MCDHKGFACIPGVQCITRKVINVLCDPIMSLCTIVMSRFNQRGINNNIIIIPSGFFFDDSFSLTSMQRNKI